MAKHNYPTVLAPGLLATGEGDYNYLNYVYRYFGGFRGNLVKDMRKAGYEFYSPNLGPFTPVWDRVCDLYAFIVGGTVDYGKAHSEKNGTARFGRTYPGVIPDWGKPGNHEKINLLGYSFGGPTVNLFNGLLMNGSEEERAATPEEELSPLFKGGNGDLLHCVCTLDGTNNGTTAIEFAGRKVINAIQTTLNAVTYAVGDSPVVRVVDFKVDQLGFQNDPAKITGKFRNPLEVKDKIKRNVNSDENMFYQMGVEYSKWLNEKYFDVNPGTYYLCYRSVRTHETKNGNQVGNVNMMPLFQLTAPIIGAYTNKKYGVDKTWLPNDGIVPLPGQSAPFGKPCEGDFRVADETKKGTWYHMPIIDGDHMTWCGWLINKRAYYNRFEDIINLCNSLD